MSRPTPGPPEPRPRRQQLRRLLRRLQRQVLRGRRRPPAPAPPCRSTTSRPTPGPPGPPRRRPICWAVTRKSASISTWSAATVAPRRTAAPKGSVLSKARPQAPDANSGVSMRLDLSSGAITTGPAWTMARADFGLASDGANLFAIGGDTTGGGYFDSSTEVDQLSLSAWPAGTWAVAPRRCRRRCRRSRPASMARGDLEHGRARLQLHLPQHQPVSHPGRHVRRRYAHRDADCPVAYPDGLRRACRLDTRARPCRPRWSARWVWTTTHSRPTAKLYVVGGPAATPAGGDLTDPLEYTPGNPGSWTTKAGTYPDNQVDNMAGGVLTVGGTPCISASAARPAASPLRPRASCLQPVADVVHAVAGDNWPGDAYARSCPAAWPSSTTSSTSSAA